MTIQKKTALLFTALTGAILILISVVAWLYMDQFAFRDFYKRLEIRGIISAKAALAAHRVDASKLYTDIREQHLELLPDEKEYFFPADSLDAFASVQAASDLPQKFFNTLHQQKEATYKRGSYFYTGLYYYDNSTPYIVIMGARSNDSLRYAGRLKVILIACCLAGLVIAYSSGLYFSQQTFKPVREIIDKAKTIEAGNLHQRLDEPRSKDEIAELTNTVNDMLSRLETAFETQNNFVSNASHEFRTPLTTIYGEAEIALSRPRTNEQYVKSLEVILQQTEKLQLLTNSLLRLAQTGFEAHKQNMGEVYIDDLLHEVKSTINSIVPENNVQVDMSSLHTGDSHVVVTGNFQLLKLALSNVIENACKYSGNQPVTVKAERRDDKLQITVRDKGIGIPESELKYIYDPFFRASNTSKFAGYGIGLPLTRNIFRLHRGAIEVTAPRDGGTQVQMTLPVA